MVILGRKIIFLINNLKFPEISSLKFPHSVHARMQLFHVCERTPDFNHQSRDGTSLSHYVWKLKDNNTPYRISWQIITRSPSFNPTKKSCSLCLKEKYCIMFRPEGATLNDRSEFYATCRHRLKPLLANS